MKSVMISIKPKWCDLIASGKKTIEVRKTKPRIKPPFKCYIYCTKPSKKYQTVSGCMVLNDDELYRHPTQGVKHGTSIELMCRDDYTEDNFLNGKVIGEFVCDKITEFYPTMDLKRLTSNHIQMVDKSCVNMRDLYNYANDKILYAWQISDLVIYENPKNVNEFYKEDFNEVLADFENLFSIGVPENCVVEYPPEPKVEDYILKRPPQSWCYCEEVEK